MALPRIFGPLPSPVQLSYLDEDFAAVGALTTIACAAVGTNTVALTPAVNTPTVGAYVNYQLFSFVAAATSTGAVTLNVNSLGDLALYLASGAAAGAGALVSGILYTVAYNSALNTGSGGFQIMAGASATSAQAGGVRGAFSNLKGINGGSPNSQWVVTADEVILENASGATFKASTVSVTISTASSGANGIDSGSVAANTWYSVWVIYNGTTVAGLLSTSATTPTLPGGYTYYARVGWIRTDGSSNLYRLLQYGRKTRFTTPPQQTMASGSVGSVTVPTWVAVTVSSFVPSTASQISMRVFNDANKIVMVAPDNSYGAYNSTTNPPIYSNGDTTNQTNAIVEMMLESTVFYWASNGANDLLLIYGWEDSL